jgi:hypothetical protein
MHSRRIIGARRHIPFITEYDDDSESFAMMAMLFPYNNSPVRVHFLVYGVFVYRIYDNDQDLEIYQANDFS